MEPIHPLQQPDAPTAGETLPDGVSSDDVRTIDGLLSLSELESRSGDMAVRGYGPIRLLEPIHHRPIQGYSQLVAFET